MSKGKRRSTSAGVQVVESGPVGPLTRVIDPSDGLPRDLQVWYWPSDYFVYVTEYNANGTSWQWALQSQDTGVAIRYATQQAAQDALDAWVAGGQAGTGAP